MPAIIVTLASESMITEPLDPLSERELEVLRLLADGLSNREIAQRLTLSPETIKWYNKHIYAKLDVSGRTHAAARARELGLLEGEKIQSPSLQPPVDAPARLPSFLTSQPDQQVDHPLFVGRDRELEARAGLLTKAAEGRLARRLGHRGQRIR